MVTSLHEIQNISEGRQAIADTHLLLLPVADQSAYRESVYVRNLLCKSAGIYLVMLLLAITLLI